MRVASTGDAVQNGSPARPNGHHVPLVNKSVPSYTVFKRYRDWVKAEVFITPSRPATKAPDIEYAVVDATIVKVHRHGQAQEEGRP